MGTICHACLFNNNLHVKSGPAFTILTITAKRTISKTKVLRVSAISMNHSTGGSIDLQATNKEDPREEHPLGFPDLQFPHDLQRHHQDDEIGENIGDLLAVVKPGRVDARALDRRVPDFIHGDAHQTSNHVHRHRPEDHDTSDHINRCFHGFDRKQSPV